MSFLSILKKIGTVALSVEHTVAPIAETLLPGPIGSAFAIIDPIFGTLQKSIMTVEMNNPVDGQGALKSASVQTDFNAAVQSLQAFLAPSGKTLQYDAGKLSQAIDAQVAAYNAFATLQKTFKIIDAPKT